MIVQNLIAKEQQKQRSPHTEFFCYCISYGIRLRQKRNSSVGWDKENIEIRILKRTIKSEKCCTLEKAERWPFFVFVLKANKKLCKTHSQIKRAANENKTALFSIQHTTHTKEHGYCHDNDSNHHLIESSEPIWQRSQRTQKVCRLTPLYKSHKHYKYTAGLFIYIPEVVRVARSVLMRLHTKLHCRLRKKELKLFAFYIWNSSNLVVFNANSVLREYGYVLAYDAHSKFDAACFVLLNLSIYLSETGSDRTFLDF